MYKRQPYTSAILDYVDFEETLTRKEVSPKQLIMLMPAAMDVTDTVEDVLTAYTSDSADLFPVVSVSSDGANLNTAFKTDFDAVLGVWVASTDAIVTGAL